MMDSASGGSMQSSSGGGGGGGGGETDEYESHGGEPMSLFLSNHDLSSPKPQQSISPQQQPPLNFFDLSDILDTSYTSLHHYASTTSHCQSVTVGSQFYSGNNNNNINQASSYMHLLSAVEESSNNNNNSGKEKADDQKNIIAIKINSKKRSRASRRAPTTILTTDTINFRQMVQEFTGIPAPPFTGGGFDLFSGSGGSSLRVSNQINSLRSHNPLRPSAQRGSSSTPPSFLSSRLINSRSDFEVVPTDNGLPPNLKHPHQTENIFKNLQNQFTFQPLQLQQSTISPVSKYRSHGSSRMDVPVPPADFDELDGRHDLHP